MPQCCIQRRAKRRAALADRLQVALPCRLHDGAYIPHMTSLHPIAEVWHTAAYTMQSPCNVSKQAFGPNLLVFIVAFNVEVCYEVFTVAVNRVCWLKLSDPSRPKYIDCVFFKHREFLLPFFMWYGKQMKPTHLESHTPPPACIWIMYCGFHQDRPWANWS